MKARGYLLAALACGALGILCLQAQGLPYAPSQGSRCRRPKGEYYEENIHKCCSLCGPGFRVLQKCNDTVDTQCVACKEGSFKEGWSRAGLCFGCSPPCKEGFVQEKTCTTTQNRVCWCSPGHFCSSLVSGKCYHCQAYRKCAMGYGVVQAGTRAADVECAPCEPGSFSHLESHLNVCTPHRICQPVLVPGNSKSDTICGSPGVHVDLGATSTQLATVTKRLPERVGTERPTFNHRDPSADTGRIVGMTAIPVVLAILICFIVFRKNGQKCIPMWDKKKQPFLPPEKFPGRWPQEPRMMGQEKDSLLRMSPSSFWESPAGPEKSHRISNGDPPKTEADNVQQRPLPLDERPCYSTADSKISENGKTHVNVSCVVSICHGAHSPSLRPSGAAETPGCHGDLPLSQEETAMKTEPGRQIAVEVEDSLDFFDPSGGKPVPLSVQDAGMTRS